MRGRLFLCAVAGFKYVHYTKLLLGKLVISGSRLSISQRFLLASNL